MPGPPDRALRRLPRPGARSGLLGVLAVVLVFVTVLVTGGSVNRSGPLRFPSPPQPAARHVERISAGARPSAEVRRLLRLGLPIYCGGPHGDAVALTFDDGPGVYTHLALRKLTDAHERATFFVVGRSIDRWPGYLRPERRVGGVEDHTYTHPVLTFLPPGQVTYQLRATARKIQAATGERVLFWRPPYEVHNRAVDKIAQRLGLVDVLWNVDSRDSLGAGHAAIVRNVEAGLRPGAIIELHENRGQTIRALATLLPALRRRHLRSVSIPQLLASDPPSRSQLHQGFRGCTREGGVPTTIKSKPRRAVRGRRRPRHARHTRRPPLG